MGNVEKVHRVLILPIRQFSRVLVVKGEGTCVWGKVQGVLRERFLTYGR